MHNSLRERSSDRYNHCSLGTSSIISLYNENKSHFLRILHREGFHRTCCRFCLILSQISTQFLRNVHKLGSLQDHNLRMLSLHPLFFGLWHLLPRETTFSEDFCTDFNFLIKPTKKNLKRLLPVCEP